MSLAILLATLSFIATAGLHLAVLHRLAPLSDARRFDRLTLWVGTFLLIGLLHVVEAGIYATAFGFGQTLGIGGFDSAGGNASPMEIYYFALVSYTSLGLGDIYPTGHLRLLAGVASLNGFLLISCSAALLFRMVSSNQHSDSQATAAAPAEARTPPSIPGRKRR